MGPESGVAAFGGRGSPWGLMKNTETAPSGPTALNGADGADGADRADRSTAADPHANAPHAHPHAHQTPPRDLGCGCGDLGWLWGG